MTVYMTEAEQLEAIKKWWLRHQNLIIACLAVVVVLVCGYRYWNWHTEKTTLQASSAYENMMSAMSKHDDKSTQSFANQLIKDNDKTVYAAVAHLTLAKIFVTQNDIQKAEQELSYVAEHSAIDPLRQLALIRLARSWYSQKLYSKALASLSTINGTAYYGSVVDELKGDIYAAQKEYTKAVASYQAALNTLHTTGLANQYLEMKNEAAKAMNTQTV